MSIIMQDIIIINFSSVFCIIKKKKKSLMTLYQFSIHVNIY